MSEKRFKSYALFKGKKTVYRDNEAYTNEEVADLLNEQQATITAQKKGLDKYMDNIIALSKENEQLQKDLYIVQTDCKNAKESKEHWRNKAKELEEKNKQIGFLKRDLYTIIRDTKETPFGNSITMTQIRERWE